jgi:hypothetical protein
VGLGRFYFKHVRLGSAKEINKTSARPKLNRRSFSTKIDAGEGFLGVVTKKFLFNSIHVCLLRGG